MPQMSVQKFSGQNVMWTAKDWTLQQSTGDFVWSSIRDELKILMKTGDNFIKILLENFAPIFWSTKITKLKRKRFIDKAAQSTFIWKMHT